MCRTHAPSVKISSIAIATAIMSVLSIILYTPVVMPNLITVALRPNSKGVFVRLTFCYTCLLFFTIICLRDWLVRYYSYYMQRDK